MNDFTTGFYDGDFDFEEPNKKLGTKRIAVAELVQSNVRIDFFKPLIQSNDKLIIY